MEFGVLGKTFIIFGIILITIGLIFSLAPKIPYVGRLPGDIYIKRENFTFYFPIATCILASLIISIIIWLVRR